MQLVPLTAIKFVGTSAIGAAVVLAALVGTSSKTIAPCLVSATDSFDRCEVGGAVAKPHSITQVDRAGEPSKSKRAKKPKPPRVAVVVPVAAAPVAAAPVVESPVVLIFEDNEPDVIEPEPLDLVAFGQGVVQPQMQVVEPEPPAEVLPVVEVSEDPQVTAQPEPEPEPEREPEPKPDKDKKPKPDRPEVPDQANEQAHRPAENGKAKT